MTSESAVIAPTTPSTEAITGSGRGALGRALRGALDGLLADERLAHGPLVRAEPAVDRCDRRSVEDGRVGAGALASGPGARGIRPPHGDGQRIRGVVRRGQLGHP